MRKIVLYHDNCPDGFTAAWAAWRQYRDGAEYRGVNYGQPMPEDIAARDVLIVDFSYPREAMDRLASVAKSVTVFDHHKTAEAALKDWTGGRVVFDMDRSGAGITWDELHPEVPRPLVVDYTEDMDLWRFSRLNAREIRETIFLTERDFAAWDALEDQLRNDFNGAAMIGEALLRAKRVRVAAVCKNARLLRFGDTWLPVVNASWDMSEIGEYLCEAFPDHPAGGYYFDRVDKRQWGFRSRGDFDVSELCKRYGGGGHAAAAGFQSEIGWLP